VVELGRPDEVRVKAFEKARAILDYDQHYSTVTAR
jgi:hypothetical protein